MIYLYSATGLWLFIGLFFFIAIRIEAVKNSHEFNVLQLIVAVFWPIWILWYGYTLITDRFKK